MSVGGIEGVSALAGEKKRRRRDKQRAQQGTEFDGPVRRNTWKRIVRNRWFLFMLIPGIVYFALFRFYPMYGAQIAFRNYVPFLGIEGSPWVGWDHFAEFFTNPDFPRLLTNTLILAALSLGVAFPLTILLALLLNELRLQILKRTVQTLVYIPHFLSWTVVVSLTLLLFTIGQGPLWHLLTDLLDTNTNFLADPAWFRPLILLQWIWKNTGWGTIIFLAALASVDQEQYEAAVIDGAGRWARVWNITLPSIKSTVVIMLILQTGSVLDTGFEQIFLMTNPLNRSVAEVFDTYVYFVGIRQGSYSYSTAVGLSKAIVGLILVFGTNWLAKRLKQPGIF